MGIQANGTDRRLWKKKKCCPNGYLIYDKDERIYSGEKIWNFIGAIGISWEIKIKEWN